MTIEYVYSGGEIARRSACITTAMYALLTITCGLALLFFMSIMAYGAFQLVSAMF